MRLRLILPDQVTYIYNISDENNILWDRPIIYIAYLMPCPSQ